MFVMEIQKYFLWICIFLTDAATSSDCMSRGCFYILSWHCWQFFNIIRFPQVIQFTSHIYTNIKMPWSITIFLYKSSSVTIVLAYNHIWKNRCIIVFNKYIADRGFPASTVFIGSSYLEDQPTGIYSSLCRQTIFFYNNFAQLSL